MTRRVAIVGVGLIGGSLALAWKERRDDLHITGWDKPSVLKAALRRRAIDEAAASLAEAANDADVVVLSVPLNAVEQTLADLAPHVRPGTLVTDVGSVKESVITAARQLLPDGVHFIGGHPMAGAEQGGLAHADAFLFENATYVLCGPEHSTAYQAAAALAESTGARVVSLDAAQHDRIAACVSHLPQLIATTLMNVVARHSNADESFLRLAAGGFRDMTRIASSPFSTWQPILEGNSIAVQEVLQEFLVAWQEVFTKFEEDDIGALGEDFDYARAVRSRIPKDFKGFLTPLCDVFVYAEDRPGTLTHITSTLFTNGINIKDIELLKIREGTGGAFRISFIDEAAADAAVAALNGAGCRAYRLA